MVDRERTRENGLSDLNLFDRGIIDSAILVGQGRRLGTTPIVAVVVTNAGVVVAIPGGVGVVVVSLVALRKVALLGKVTGSATVVA